MSIGLGGLVSVGGGTGGSSGGSGSGITSINGQQGPAIVEVGVNGIVVTAAGNQIVFNAAALSGLIATATGSGIREINSQTGPAIQVSGINGIGVSQPRSNFILIDYVPLSGIFDINGEDGPHIVVDGVNGASIITGTDRLTVDVSALSGLIQTFTGSGITRINDQQGPEIQISGINGIEVTQPRSNFILLDGAAISGTTGGGGMNACYTTSFTGVLEQTFTHALGTKAIVVQIQDENDEFIEADLITSTDINNVTIRFNQPQSGRLTVVSCGGTIATSGVTKFAASFLNVTSGQFTHGFSTRDVLIQVYDTNGPPRQLMPDDIILDTLDTISLLFNAAQSGRVVIMG